MGPTAFFLTSKPFLQNHEKDVVRRKEWTIFPGLSRFSDDAGYLIFTAAHIPLIFLMLAGFTGGVVFQPAIRIILDVFCLAHVGLHVLYHRLPKNGFHSRFSRIIISGTCLSGLIDLMIIFFIRKDYVEIHRAVNSC